MNVTEESNKVKILVSALEERYSSMHKIRERVQNIGIWSLGLLLGTGGWLIQSDIILGCPQKVIFIMGIIVSFIVLRFVYLGDLNKGFRGQQRIAVNIERNLGLFTVKAFNDIDESIYPKSWEKAGQEGSDGKFFNSTYKLLYIGFIFMIIAIIFNGAPLKLADKHFKPDLMPQHWEMR